MLEDKRGKVERLGFRHGIHMICCWNERKKSTVLSAPYVLEDENSVRRRRVATDSEERDSSSSSRKKNWSYSYLHRNYSGRPSRGDTVCEVEEREKKKSTEPEENARGKAAALKMPRSVLFSPF